MSTVKISDLPEITQLNSNTSNTLIVGVDIPTDITGKITATTLARSLYSNNVLNVGNNDIIFPGIIAQFVGNNESYLQVNLQNLKSNGSTDYVATADIGTDTVNYIDMGIAGSTDEDPSYPIIKPMDGYVYVQGNTSTTVGGNLLFGTITTHRDISFFQGGTGANNVVAKFVYNSGLHLLQKPITFADGTSQNTSFAGAATAANAAFLQANTPSHVANSAALYANGAFLQANTPSHVANSAALYANGAFTKANNALANTSGTFGGDLTISGNVTVLGTTSSTGPISTGNLIVNGTSSFTGNVTMNATTYLTGAVTVNSTMLLANSNFSATAAALTISASPSVATPSNDGYMIHISGKNGVPSRIVADSYGANAYIVFAGRAARGNVSHPTALQANDVIARFSGNGYGTTGYAPLGTGRIDFVATENYTDTARGSRIEFWNMPVGSNTLNKIASFNGDSVDFTGAIKPEKGLVYSPNVQATLTTFAINFERDSLIKFDVNADASITLSNYVYGKVVEVWITNSAAQNKTITHGCLANNSTSKATSFTILSNSCAYLRYFSIDGDQANTFVSITA
jgi:hypothetical protein